MPAFRPLPISNLYRCFNVWLEDTPATNRVGQGKTSGSAYFETRCAVCAPLVHFSRFHTSAHRAGNKPVYFQYDEAD